MFLGLSNLINPAAIQLTKANAFQAARTVLGLNAPTATLLAIAEKYTNHILPLTSRALSVGQILGDINFSKFVAEGQDSGSKTDKLEKFISGSSSLGLTDSLAFGIPNWVLYSGVSILAYQIYRRKKAGGLKFFKAPTASVVPSAAPVKA